MIAVLVLSGCGSGDDTNRVGGAPSASAAPRKAYDPPTKFDDSTAVQLPGTAAGNGNYREVGILYAPAPIALVDTTAFVVARDALVVVDVTDGKVRETIKPELQLADEKLYNKIAGNDPMPPIVTNIEGGRAVLAPFAVSVPGQGTTPAGIAVEIVAVRVDGTKKMWSARVNVQLSTKVIEGHNMALLGVASGIAVLRAGGSTYGVDLRTQRTVWQRPDFQGVTVTGETIVGFSSNGEGLEMLEGANAADGVQRWVDKTGDTSFLIWPAGLRFVAVNGMNRSNAFRIVEASTGRKVNAPQTGGEGPATPNCYYDQVGVTVCWDIDRSGFEWTGAFDAHTGEWLWHLPDRKTNRTYVRVTTAWRGAVYGTTSNGPVVLDARTGADREANPVAAPFLVNGYVGITNWPTRGPGVFAIGAAG
jgi:hypothetical protein